MGTLTLTLPASLSDDIFVTWSAALGPPAEGVAGSVAFFPADFQSANVWPAGFWPANPSTVEGSGVLGSVPFFPAGCQSANFWPANFWPANASVTLTPHGRRRSPVGGLPFVPGNLGPLFTP